MAGVNLTGRSPAEVNPIAGSRSAVPDINLSGVATSVAGLAEVANTNATTQAKVAKVEGTQDLALGELDVQFAFAAGEDSDKLARLATGFEGETGIALDDAQKADLAEFQQLVNRIDNARRQGKSEVGLELALNRYRRRMLTKHPGLAPELLELSGKVNTLSKNAVEIQVEEETAARAEQRARFKQLSDTTQNWGIPTVGMSNSEVLATYNKEIGPRVQSLAIWRNEEDVLKAKSNISELERKQESDRIYKDHVDDLWGNVAADVSSVVSDVNLDPNAKAAGVAQVIAKWQANIREATGADATEMTAKYGFVFEPLTKLAEGLASGSISKEAAANQVAYLQSVSKLGLFKKSPQALALQPVIEIYGNLMAGFAKDPAYSKMIGAVLTSGLRGIQTEGNPTGGVEEAGGLPVADDFMTPTQISLEAKRATQISDGIYAKPPSERSKKDLVNLSVSFLTSPQSKRTLAGVHDILPTIANPKFVEYSQGLTIPQDALNMVNEYASQTNANAAQLFQKEGDNLIATLNPDGTVAFDVRNPSRNRVDIKRVEANLNRAIRAYAHLEGHTDYRKVAEQFASEIQAGAESGN